jgi:C-terminal processing protease CtpA/Prc
MHLIIKIDGVDVSDSSAELVAAKCRVMPGDKVDVDFLRPDDDVGKPRHVTLTRTKIHSINDIQSTTFVSSMGGKTIG